MKIWNRVKAALRAELESFRKELEQYKGTSAFVVLASPFPF